MGLPDADDVLGFAVKAPNQVLRTIDNFTDEMRQINVHYESILSILDKIKEIKVPETHQKIQEELEATGEGFSQDKEEALSRCIVETEEVVLERRKTSEVLCTVLEEYNQLISLLNKRVLYLDHLLALKEQAK